MISDGRGGSRREFLASSLKLIGAGAIVVASSRGPARVAAQDEGIGAGGRQGGDGGGGRRRQDGASAPGGVGSGGRSATLPTVNGMPSTGVMDGGAASSPGGVTPLLLAAGAVGAAAMAIKTRTMPAAVSRD